MRMRDSFFLGIEDRLLLMLLLLFGFGRVWEFVCGNLGEEVHSRS